MRWETVTSCSHRFQRRGIVDRCATRQSPWTIDAQIHATSEDAIVSLTIEDLADSRTDTPSAEGATSRKTGKLSGAIVEQVLLAGAALPFTALNWCPLEQQPP